MGNNDVLDRMPERRIKKLDRLFEAFSIVAEGTYVYICDMRYDVSRWSTSAVITFGLPSEYMYAAGEIWEEKIHPDDRETYHKGIEEIFSGTSSGHDMQYRAKNIEGNYDVCTCRGTVLLDDNDNLNYFVGVIRNHGIHSHVDALTGLRNQYGMMEDLQYNISNQTEMLFTMVGISHFSEYNEVYGYHFGNKILQNFARYIYDFVGNTGSVYRLDGTKFAIISKSGSAELVKQNYEKVRNHFRKGFKVEDKDIILDLNAGFLFINNFSIDYQTVYSCANFAYSESKQRKQGDMVFFANDLTDDNRFRLEKFHAIRGSIMQNFEGFFLVYQPVVDSNTEKLIGAEALLRWKNDKYGLVSPDEFIPLLEKDPLFPELGEWILKRALRDAKEIIKKYPNFVINVNLSYTQLEKPDFVEMVIRSIEECDFPANHLCLEITERCRLLDMELLKNVVVNLRGHGVQIALDDFGTGFSSVGIVKNLPFDTIKIDRSFVMRIEEDDKEKELIEHFVNLAATFGARVCVEGVETEGMKRILKNYPVKSFQGYYYAKPLILEDFLKWRS
jgi:diguanylate cyclase (GGDEF)-like protein